MFAKLALVILASGLTAATLLVTRQHRIETAHDMAEVHEQILRHERSLWHLRSEIARRCRPDAVRELLDELDDEWNPICDPRSTEPTPAPAAPSAPPPRALSQAPEPDEHLPVTPSPR